MPVPRPSTRGCRFLKKKGGKKFFRLAYFHLVKFSEYQAKMVLGVNFDFLKGGVKYLGYPGVDINFFSREKGDGDFSITIRGKEIFFK